MIVLEALPGLQVDSPLVAPGAVNFQPPSWPPPDDFPVIIDADGSVVSCYGDHTWNLAPWAGKPLSIAFGDSTSSRGASVSAENGALFRQIAAWWLYGPNAVMSATSLASRHTSLKPLFVACSEAGILASNLSRFPRMIDVVASRFVKANANRTFGLLHILHEARDELGFELLDATGLKQLSARLPERESVQTPYIPPRIWTYQVLRLRECLDDYLTHRDKVEACFRFCMQAYRRNAGSWAQVFANRLSPHHRPFTHLQEAGHIDRDGRRFYGKFHLVARRFGIDGLLDRWVSFTDRAGVNALSSYLSLVSIAGLAYVLNFSLMRIDECMQLRAGCHSVERDSLGDDIHLLSGVSTKTVEDDDARWIVSSSVQVAIEAMTSVARLRMDAARRDPRVKLGRTDLAGPLLQTRAYEPWAPALGKTNKIRKKHHSYGEFVKSYPKLFDQGQLRITNADSALAHTMTFGLDPGEFAIGNVWPLAWHQLRRTGACNMLSTGIVSEGSLQYQLKHCSRAMSRYYGQNHYKLVGRLDEDAQGLYIREMYQAVVREFSSLQDDRYISPHGPKRKAQILVPISEKDHNSLAKDAEAGRISYRPTFLGGCAKPGPACPLGGISNLSGCMGHGEGVPCEWALLDRKKRAAIEDLCGTFKEQLKLAPHGSPLRESLQAQVESAERAIDVLDTL